MLSLSSPAYQTSLCRAQPASDVFYPYVCPTENGFQFGPMLHGSKGFPVLSPAAHIVTNATTAPVEKPNSVARATINARQQSLDQTCHLTDTHHEILSQTAINQMNGSDDPRMTGSSNQRAEQLSWLAEVATGAASARVPNLTPAASPDNDKTNSPTTPIHLNSDTDHRSSLGTILLGSSPANPRMYAPSFPPERLHLPPPTQHHHHQTSAVSGSGLSLYYSQAPRSTPYTNFYQTDYRSSLSMPFHPCVNDGVSQQRLSRPYFQSNAYSPTLTSMANAHLQNAHASLPHSPSGYLPSSAITSSPIVFSSSSPSSQHGRMSLTFSSVPINRTVQEQISQEHQNNHLTLQVLGQRRSPQFHQDERRRSYKSPEPNLALKSESPARDSLPLMYSSDSSSSKESRHNPSPSHLSYKVPTGKEGSLKHRILRPPSINILEPPQSILDAPLSAPPIRTHREPSPKQLKQDSYRSISTSSSFFLDSSQTHTLVQNDAPRLSPAFVVPSDSKSVPVNNAPNPPNPADCGPHNLKYPPAFMKGSIIQLANSQLKPVEQMTTEDFMECEALSSNLKIDSSTVNSIEKMPSTGSAKLGFSVGPNKFQITVEAPLEHPFFVYMQGWSSCCPERSLLRYGLACNKLKVGDTCIFLTVKSDVNTSPMKSSCSVPTNHVSEPPNVSLSFEASKGGIVQCVTSKSFNCSLGYNSTPEKKATKTNSPSQRERKHLMPLFLPNSSSSSAPKSDAAAAPKKRKRRWSAPDGHVTNDPPCSST